MDEIINLDLRERIQDGWEQDSWIKNKNKITLCCTWGMENTKKLGGKEKRDTHLKPTLKDSLMKQVKKCFAPSSILFVS